jgi:ankyrin repeat protein
MGKKKGGGGGKGKQPLFAAVDDEDVDALTALLAGGASLESRNGDGWTPLIAAAYVGNADLVDVLLKEGADVSCDARVMVAVVVVGGR